MLKSYSSAPDPSVITPLSSDVIVGVHPHLLSPRQVSIMLTKGTENCPARQLTHNPPALDDWPSRQLKHAPPPLDDWPALHFTHMLGGPVHPALHAQLSIEVLASGEYELGGHTLHLYLFSILGTISLLTKSDQPHVTIHPEVGTVSEPDGTDKITEFGPCLLPMNQYHCPSIISRYKWLFPPIMLQVGSSNPMTAFCVYTPKILISAEHDDSTGLVLARATCCTRHDIVVEVSRITYRAQPSVRTGVPRVALARGDGRASDWRVRELRAVLTRPASCLYFIRTRVTDRAQPSVRTGVPPVALARGDG